MRVAKPIHRLTEVEYLDLERSLESKNEFFDGEVFAMSGGTPLHSQIAANLIQVIGRRLSGGRCVVYTSSHSRPDTAASNSMSDSAQLLHSRARHAIHTKVCSVSTSARWRSCPIEAHNQHPMS